MVKRDLDLKDLVSGLRVENSDCQIRIFRCNIVVSRIEVVRQRVFIIVLVENLNGEVAVVQHKFWQVTKVKMYLGNT